MLCIFYLSISRLKHKTQFQLHYRVQDSQWECVYRGPKSIRTLKSHLKCVNDVAFDSNDQTKWHLQTNYARLYNRFSLYLTNDFQWIDFQIDLHTVVAQLWACSTNNWQLEIVKIGYLFSWFWTKQYIYFFIISKLFGKHFEKCVLVQLFCKMNATWFDILLSNAMSFQYIYVFFKCPDNFWDHCTFT